MNDQESVHKHIEINEPLSSDAAAALIESTIDNIKKLIDLSTSEQHQSILKSMLVHAGLYMSIAKMKADVSIGIDIGGCALWIDAVTKMSAANSYSVDSISFKKDRDSLFADVISSMVIKLQTAILRISVMLNQNKVAKDEIDDALYSVAMLEATSANLISISKSPLLVDADTVSGFFNDAIDLCVFCDNIVIENSSENNLPA